MTEPLKAILENPRKVIFLGAGASYDSGLPLGDAAACIIVEKLFYLCNKTKLLSSIVNDSPGLQLKWPRFEVVLDILSQYLPSPPVGLLSTFNKVGLSATHRLLAKYNTPETIWLTTNFDDQIERAIRENNKYKVINDRKPLLSLNRYDAKETIIIKLHGDDLTQDLEYGLGYKIDQILRTLPIRFKNAIDKFVANRPIVFVGYAARDPDLYPLIELMISHAPAVAWIGYNDPPDSVRKLIMDHKHITYYNDGSPRAFENALTINAPVLKQEKGLWERKVDTWISEIDALCALQALASICLARGDIKSRKAAHELNNSIYSDDYQHRLWKINREVQWIMREPGALKRDIIERLGSELMGIVKTKSIQNSLRINALTAAAELYLKTDNVLVAERLLHRAVRMSLLEKSDIKVRVLIGKGKIELYRGARYFAKSYQTFKKARLLAKRAGLPVLEAELVREMATCLMRWDKGGKAENLLKKSESVIREIGNPHYSIRWKINLAEALRYQRKFEDSKKLNGELLEQGKLFGEDEVIMTASGNHGLCQAYLGNIAEADKAFHIAFATAVRRCHGEAMNNALYNIGWLRVVLGQWSDAIDPFTRAAQGYHSYGSLEREGGALSLLIWCNIRMGNKREAARIMRRITVNNMIPKGVFSSEFKLAHYALYPVTDSIRAAIARINTLFRLKPEQKFYLFSWMLEKHASSLELHLLEILVKSTLKAAEKSQIRPYYNVLHDIIQERNLHTKDFYRQLLRSNAIKLVADIKPLPKVSYGQA